MKISLKGKKVIVETKILGIFAILAARLLKRYCKGGKCSVCEFYGPNSCGLYKYPYRWEVSK